MSVKMRLASQGSETYPIRENLDVTGKKSDEELWTALEIALVKDAISDLPEGLDTEIIDEGETEFCNKIMVYFLFKALLYNICMNQKQYAASST